jgi:ubiquinone/menaquinone biosynthesis C-methylase UbiE
MDFKDESFDLVFGMFMWHEIPPQRYPALLSELHRVLAAGGRFATIEFHVNPDSAVQRAMQVSHGWLNNEVYSSSWYSAPMEQLARDAGFSRVSIEVCDRLTGRQDDSGRNVGLACWNLYLFEK